MRKAPASPRGFARAGPAPWLPSWPPWYAPPRPSCQPLGLVRVMPERVRAVRVGHRRGCRFGATCDLPRPGSRAVVLYKKGLPPFRVTPPSSPSRARHTQAGLQCFPEGKSLADMNMSYIQNDVRETRQSTKKFHLTNTPGMRVRARITNALTRETGCACPPKTRLQIEFS